MTRNYNMKQMLLAAAALAALSAPAHAYTFTPQTVGMDVANTIQIIRSAILHQPSLRTERRCTRAHECGVIESVRDDDSIDVIIHPDSNPEDLTWCYVLREQPNQRLWQKAGPNHTRAIWFEAYLPQQGEFREFDT
jgi:hypothetical protein